MNLLEALCSDCAGGPERCAREGHLRTWDLESKDPAVAVFVCARCNGRFELARCASCGRIVEEQSREGCTHPPSGEPRPPLA